MLSVVVCGDNGIAASIVAVACLHGHDVRHLRLCESDEVKEFICTLPNGTSFMARPTLISNDPERAFNGAEVIFICIDHVEIEPTLRALSRYIPPQALVGGAPGFGGFGVHARHHFSSNLIFGLQRIPFVIADYSPEWGVRIGGVRRQSFVGTIPAERALSVANLLRTVLGVPTVPVPHYINIELSPSNSIVNPARLYSLFADRHPSAFPPATTEFFGDWDLPSSVSLLSLEAELRAACERIPRDTCFVAPILFQYDANDLSTLTLRIRGLTALHGRPIPLDASGATPRLDTASRYFTEDVDIGLTILKSIFRLAGTETPFCDKVLAWRSSTIEHQSYALEERRPDSVIAFGDLNALCEWLD